MSFLFGATALGSVGAACVLIGAVFAVLAISRQRRSRAAKAQIAALAAQLSAMRIEIAAREAGAALQSARIDQLERQNQDLEQFAHIASHDLRAPLRAIANLAEWIEEDSGQNISEESREHLTLLRSRVTRLQRLLRDLLHYSRAGRGEVTIEPVDLTVLAAEVAEEIGPEQAERLNFSVALNSDEPLPTLETAKAPLRQVLANLVSNAVKHHDRERASVILDIAHSGDWLVLTVTDDGPGIDPALIPKALTMFQTLKSRDEVESTGMGLALVKRLAESAGGTLELESPVADGRGLAAVVRWPVTWPQKASQ